MLHQFSMERSRKRACSPGRAAAAAAAITLAVALAAPTSAVQGGRPAGRAATAADLDRASHLVMPQHRAWSLRADHPQTVQITSVAARVEIREHTASTTIEIRLHNPSSRQAEAVLLLPVPDHAAVGSFMFEGAASEPTAQLLRADEARREYDAIVRRLRDPALLEFAGYNLIRSSVFPVEAKGTQKVRLTYEHVLSGDGNRIDYVLPRSESLERVLPWDITVNIQAQSPISMVYSPSHDLIETRHEPKHLTVTVAESSRTDAGSFRLSYLLERDGVTASLFAYPDPKVGGGYFLLLAGLPNHSHEARNGIKREVTLVLDRSGSMAGGKLDQVRDAAVQIIEALADGESFNIIDYSTAVSTFSREPVLRTDETIRAAREYLGRMRPGGGTNIHDALLEALRQRPREGVLPLVLFLTDGLPTVSKTSEIDIRSMVEAGNVHNRRVFTIGVGHDVNVPLLDRLAEISRAVSTYILPDEDVELKVAQTFRRLYGPVLADVELLTSGADGNDSTRLVQELIPHELPDVFSGDHIVLLGQYRENQPVTFELSGNYLGEQRMFSFTFDFNLATTQNSFVPRLWAARRIAHLVDQVRQHGAFASGQPLAVRESILNDPKYREIVDEIVRLSTEFGILSEYTAFLALEGTDLGDWNDLLAACSYNLDNRAIRDRSGIGAMNQGLNVTHAKSQTKLNYDNQYWNAQMEAVAHTAVQQINDRAFFKRGNQWIDARLVSQPHDTQPDRIIEFGSQEHLDMLRAMVAQNRQGCLSLEGDILIEYEAQTVLIRNRADAGGQ